MMPFGSTHSVKGTVSFMDANGTMHSFKASRVLVEHGADAKELIGVAGALDASDPIERQGLLLTKMDIHKTPPPRTDYYYGPMTLAK